MPAERQLNFAFVLRGVAIPTSRTSEDLHRAVGGDHGRRVVFSDMLQGPNIRAHAVSWLGSVPNREDLAKRLSPLHYVRPGLPPILTIHGDADTIVPYSHAVRLHEALTKAGVKNQLLTIPGGGHGDFTADQMLKAFETIRTFLANAGITPTPK